MFSKVKAGVFAVAVTVSVSALTFSEVYAAEKQQLSKKMKPAFEAKELIDQKKFKEALVKLNEAVAVPDKTAYEQSVTNDMLAYCYGQLKDYANLAKLYETQMAANQIPADQLASKIKFLAGHYNRQKDYAKAIQFGSRYLKDYGADEDITDNLIRANFAKGDYKACADLSSKQIKAIVQSKKVPEKVLYDFLINSYFKLDDKSGMANTTEDMLSYYPTPDLWRSAFKSVRAEATFSDRETIEIYRLRHAIGILDPKEFVDMAELSLASANPGDARVALEASLSSGAATDPKDKERINRLLTKARVDADADLKALAGIEKEAAAKPKGDPLARVGSAYLGHGKYEQAVGAIKAGLAKGSLTSTDLANIQLGAAYVLSGKKVEALTAFKAVPSSSKLARLARLWSVFANSKK